MRYVIAAGLAVAILLMGVAEAIFEEMEMHGAVKWIVRVALVFLLGFAFLISTRAVQARDDGRYASSPLKPWFDGLRSKKGSCCSDADGTALSDVDWDVKDGHYRVRIEGQWWDVPDDAVITEPNLAGRTMVWPIYYRNEPGLRIDIRCFLPGPGT